MSETSRRPWIQSEDDQDIAISPTKHEFRWWTRPLARLNFLEETADLLAQALSAVQWVTVIRDGAEIRACPACGGREPSHIAGCSTALALARLKADQDLPLG
jgi:hypothetical protein